MGVFPIIPCYLELDVIPVRVGAGVQLQKTRNPSNVHLFFGGEMACTLLRLFCVKSLIVLKNRFFLFRVSGVARFTVKRLFCNFPSLFQDKHVSSPYAHSRQRIGDEGGGGGDATPTSEGEATTAPSHAAATAAAHHHQHHQQHHLHPSGAVSLSAAIQRITAQHNVSKLFSSCCLAMPLLPVFIVPVDHLSNHLG